MWRESGEKEVRETVDEASLVPQKKSSKFGPLIVAPPSDPAAVWTFSAFLEFCVPELELAECTLTLNPALPLSNPKRPPT